MVQGTNITKAKMIVQKHKFIATWKVAGGWPDSYTMWKIEALSSIFDNLEILAFI